MACFNENKANLCSKKLSAIFVNHVLICFIYCNSFILVYRYIYIYVCWPTCRHITWEEEAVLAFLAFRVQAKLTSLILGASILLPFPRTSFLPTFPSFPAFLLGLAFPSLALAGAGAAPSTWAFFRWCFSKLACGCLALSRRCFAKLFICCCHRHQGQLCFARHIELFQAHQQFMVLVPGELGSQPMGRVVGSGAKWLHPQPAIETGSSVFAGREPRYKPGKHIGLVWANLKVERLNCLLTHIRKLGRDSKALIPGGMQSLSFAQSWSTYAHRLPDQPGYPRAFPST